MLIEVRTDGNVQGSEQLSDEVKTVVQTTLDRFGDRIRRVDVYLSDATGNKAGHDDKCCKIEARRDGREPIIVTHHETTMDQAIRQVRWRRCLGNLLFHGRARAALRAE